MKIKVTQEHINKGIPTYGRCPVALALREQIPDVVDVCVTKPSIAVHTRIRHRLFSTPVSVSAFIDDFDTGWDVGIAAKPFEFELPYGD